MLTVSTAIGQHQEQPDAVCARQSEHHLANRIRNLLQRQGERQQLGRGNDEKDEDFGCGIRYLTECAAADLKLNSPSNTPPAARNIECAANAEISVAVANHISKTDEAISDGQAVRRAWRRSTRPDTGIRGLWSLDRCRRFPEDDAHDDPGQHNQSDRQRAIRRRTCADRAGWQPKAEDDQVDAGRNGFRHHL